MRWSKVPREATASEGSKRRSGKRTRPRPPFAHGARVELGPRLLLGSYHVSQQNTQTGRLTPRRLDAVLAEALSRRG